MQVIETWDGNKRRQLYVEFTGNYCSIKHHMQVNKNYPYALIDLDLGYILLLGQAYLIINLENYLYGV